MRTFNDRSGKVARRARKLWWRRASMSLSEWIVGRGVAS